MTCEVLLMNLEAVAFAADSAVTMFDSYGRSFSQSGVDKVIMINEAAPVAVMIYGGGAFGGQPWRTVLGQFKQVCGDEPLAIETYAARLITFLSDIEQRGGVAIHEDDEVLNLYFYVFYFVNRYAELLVEMGYSGGVALDEASAWTALAFLREEIHFEGHYVGELNEPDPKPALRNRIWDMTSRLSGFLEQHVGPMMANALGSHFNQTRLPEDIVGELIKLLVESVLLEWLPPSCPRTGLVIAGFGEGSATPSYCTLEFSGAFGGLLQYRVAAFAAPRPGQHAVVFETFAQDDLIQAFRYGANPRFIQVAMRAAVGALTGALNPVAQQVARTNRSLGEQLVGHFDMVRVEAPRQALLLAIADRQELINQSLDRLLRSANAGLLAGYAQKLLDLSIIEHELLRQESVARPISVLSMQRGSWTLTKDGA